MSYFNHWPWWWNAFEFLLATRTKCDFFSLSPWVLMNLFLIVKRNFHSIANLRINGNSKSVYPLYINVFIYSSLCWLKDKLSILAADLPNEGSKCKNIMYFKQILILNMKTNNLIMFRDWEVFLFNHRPVICWLRQRKIISYPTSMEFSLQLGWAHIFTTLFHKNIFR